MKVNLVYKVHCTVRSTVLCVQYWNSRMHLNTYKCIQGSSMLNSAPNEYTVPDVFLEHSDSVLCAGESHVVPQDIETALTQQIPRCKLLYYIYTLYSIRSTVKSMKCTVSYIVESEGCCVLLQELQVFMKEERLRELLRGERVRRGGGQTQGVQVAHTAKV